MAAFTGQVINDVLIENAISNVESQEGQVQIDKVNGAYLALQQQAAATSLDLNNGLCC